MNPTEIVRDFLKRHKMYFEDIDFDMECGKFVDEMKTGLESECGSLKMIPTYISLDKEFECNKNVIVMDAGGTNLRVALVHFDENINPVIDYFDKHPMPGMTGRISKNQFYEKIVEYLEPIAGKSDRIGFCFSFPTEILPNRDGRIIRFNKEVNVDGMEGELIGSGVVNALKAHGTNIKSIVMLNDTVATLLGAKAAANARAFDSYIGYILGTGTNTCYIEKNNNITKNSQIAASCGTQIINIESGGYDKASRSDIDDLFDSETAAPGSQLFEKMVSGAYQGGLLLKILKQMCREEIFSEKTGKNIKALDELAAKSIDDFCFYPYGGNPLADITADDEDRLLVSSAIEAFMERIAKLSAVNLCAVMLKSGAGKNPCKPVCISAEGTTFYKSKLFKGKLDYYMRVNAKDKYGLNYEFVKVNDSTIIGAAVTGLLG